MPASTLGFDKISVNIIIQLELADDDPNIRPFESLPVTVTHVCCSCKDELVRANCKMVSDYE